MITIAGGAQVYRDWLGTSGDDLLAALRGCFSYYRDGRAGGLLYSPGQQWPAPLALLGPPLLPLVAATAGTGPFSNVSFQAYLDGAGCDWHTDKPYTGQAILSLGVTRRFGLRSPEGLEVWTEVSDGDLVFMPAAWQAGNWEHTVPHQELRGERCSLVFRTGE